MSAMQLLILIMEKACLHILEKMNVDAGIYMKKMCDEFNQRRKSSSVCKATDFCKKRRKIKRARRNYKQGKLVEKEGNRRLLIFDFILYIIYFLDFSVFQVFGIRVGSYLGEFLSNCPQTFAVC